MAATMNLGLGSNSWDIDMYETLGSASHSYATASQTTLSSGLKKLELAWDLRTLSVRLSRFLDNLYEAMNKVDAGKGQAQSATPEQVEQAVRSLEYLYEILNRLCCTAKQRGLTNQSLMAGSLKTIMRRSEELLDFADWLHAVVANRPEKLDAIYASGRAELAEGAVYDLSSVG